MNTPYEIKFIPRHISDPYRTYAWTFMLYRARDYAPADSLNAYTGILNRIAHSLHTKTLCGNPVSILEMTLIWYNKPDSAKLNNQRPVRAPHQPSWSWTAWTKCPAVTFLPPGGQSARQDWIDSRTSQLHFYYTRHDGTGFKRLQNGAPVRNTPPVPATPCFPAGARHRFLQFYTGLTTNARVVFGTLGIGQIYSPAGQLVGMLYDDSLADYTPEGNILAMMPPSTHGDNDFDYGYYNPEISGPLHNGQTSSDGVQRPPVSAKNAVIRFVLLLRYDGNICRRRGLGFVYENTLTQFSWNNQWIALA